MIKLLVLYIYYKNSSLCEDALGQLYDEWTSPKVMSYCIYYLEPRLQVSIGVGLDKILYCAYENWYKLGPKSESVYGYYYPPINEWAGMPLDVGDGNSGDFRDVHIYGHWIVIMGFWVR